MHLPAWQHPPFRHVLFAQHCCPPPPHTSQLPAPPSPGAMQSVPDVEQSALGRTHWLAAGSQQAPVPEHGEPLVQHTSPEPPHEQVPPWHASPTPHVLFAQQGSPLPPHAAQEPPWQLEFAAVQVPPASVGQHAWLSAPQPVHEPFSQMESVPEHAAPVPTHVIAVGSQQPFGQVWFAQHVPPLAPQGTQEPVWQMVFACEQSVPSPTQSPVPGSQQPWEHVPS